MQKTIIYSYLFVLLVILGAIAYSGCYSLDLIGDSLMYGHGKSGIDYAIDNFLNINGRWAQGLTNDYRLYTFRGLSTVLSFSFFLASAFIFIKFLVKKNISALIVTLSFYFAVVFSLKGFYDFTFNLSVVLSYTTGLGLVLLLIPSIYKYNLTNSKKYLWLILFILVFTSGLLEIYGITTLLMLGLLLVLEVIQKKKIKLTTGLFFLISLAFNLLTFFSPGNMARRADSDTTLAFDFSVITDLYVRNLSNLINLNTLTFFLITVLVGITSKSVYDKNLSKPISVFLFLTFFLLLTILPIALITIASPDRAMQLVRVENISVIFMLIFIFLLAFLIGNKIGLSIPKNIVYLLFFLPLLTFCTTYFSEENDNGSKKIYTQLITGDLKKYHDHEMAIRDFLSSTPKGKVKSIPILLKEDYAYTVIGLPNGFTFKNRKTAHRSYEEVFNNGEIINLKRDYPNPLLFSSIYFFEKGEREQVEKVFSNDFFQVYLNKKYNTFILKKVKPSDNTIFSFKFRNHNIEVNWDKEVTKYPEYYKEHPNIIGMLARKSIKEAENLADKLKISFKISLKKEDILTLYYKQGRKPYSEEGSIRKSIPSHRDQYVDFIIPIDEGFPQNIRFDFGSKKNQEITIQQIHFNTKKNTKIIKQSEVKDYFNSPEKWNRVLNADSAKYGVKEVNNFVDAKLIGNKKLYSLLRTLKNK